jgi:membrane fusion protein (multidrug efflux system)
MLLAFTRNVRSNRTGSGQRYIATLALTATAFLAGCGEGTDTDANDDAEAPPVPVEVTTPGRGEIVARYTGTAPIEAFADALVIAKTGGEITEILVEEGDDVEAGQVLARLDGERLELALAETRARLEKLKQSYSRNVELRDKSLISDGDFEAIQFEMEALQAAFELAKLELSYTAIRTPISGVVSARHIKVGNTIEVNAEAFGVTSLEPLIAYLYVPEREYQRMRDGLAAEISVDALPGTRFTGTVARTSPVVDPATGTFKLTIEVVDESRRLKPGMFGRVDIVSDRRPDALTIPRAAILESAGQEYVYVVHDGLAEKRVIETGYVEGAAVEVRAGLNDDEQLVVVGQTSLRNNSHVSVVEPKPTAAMQPALLADRG